MQTITKKIVLDDGRVLKCHIPISASSDTNFPNSKVHSIVSESHSIGTLPPTDKRRSRAFIPSLERCLYTTSNFRFSMGILF